MCGSFKGKLFHATKENTKLKQEIAYLTSRLERTVVSKKLIEDDLSLVEESATKSTYKLGVGFERCEDKGGKCAPKFIPSSNYHKEEETINSKEEETIQSKAILQRQERSEERNSQAERGTFCLHVFWPCWSLRWVFLLSQENSEKAF
jgi:hypothetical protein